MLEREKARRIIDELLTYFFSHEINQSHVDITFASDGFHTTIQGTCEQLPSDIYDFLEMLNTPRDRDLESYYDELLGGHHSLHEEKDYNLLGMMIDEADILYENQQLRIEVFRQR